MQESRKRNTCSEVSVTNEKKNKTLRLSDDVKPLSLELSSEEKINRKAESDATEKEESDDSDESDEEEETKNTDTTNQQIDCNKHVLFPIVFTDGYVQHEMQDPFTYGLAKKRNWWITAPVNWGKTKWVTITLGGTRCFVVSHDDDNRWKYYQHEKIIIFDDVIPTRRGDLAMLERSYFISQRIGNIRRHFHHNVNFIVLSTMTIEQAYCNMPGEWDFIKARFTEIVCTRPYCGNPWLPQKQSERS